MDSINKPLKILLTTNALILISGYMLGPIYAIFVERVGGDLLDASVAGGIYALVAGLVTILSGKYADRIKENELVIVLGYLIVSLGFISFLWVNSIYSLFLVQAIIGFGEAIYSPAFDAVYSKHLDGKKSGLQWGAWESMNYFVASLGAFLGGILATYFGFEILFIIMFTLSITSALYILSLKRKLL